MIACSTSSGMWSQISDAGNGEARRKVEPGFAALSMSYFSRYGKQWHAVKSALLTKYGLRIMSEPKRRCEIVTPPDFLESYSK